MRIFSTFSGIGGFEIGIERAFSSVKRQRESPEAPARDSEGLGKQLPQLGLQRLDVIGYSEIDRYAASVYQYHFPGVKNYGDITKINEKELPDFDCLVGGFPCQAFSIAGKRRGFLDTRGTLFFDIARILRVKKPRTLVLENVKGLLSHDGGNTFRTIIATITELGYDVQWQVINSKNHGVPQNRERVYIVGHLRGTPRPEVFPIHGSGGEAEATTHPTIDANYYKGYSNQRRMLAVPEATKRGYAEATVGQAINLSVPNSKTRRGRVSDIAPTLDTGMQLHTLTEDVQIRRLTPKECERLQGFPDDWTKYGASDPNHRYTKMLSYDNAPTEISDTQRYKMCGNAVTTNVVQAVFERLLANAQ